MLTLNATRSGVLPGVGPQKLRVTLDADSRTEFDGLPAKQMAMKVAAENGFGNGGLCEQPQVNAVNEATDDLLEDKDAFNPTARIKGFRAEFTFANRI